MPHRAWAPDFAGGASMRVARLPRRIDPVIHERVRLGVVSALASAGALSFSDLRAVLGVTDGNLYVHLSVLEEERYVSATRGRDENRSRTEYRLTPRGRRAFRRYVDVLEGVLRSAGGGGAE